MNALSLFAFLLLPSLWFLGIHVNDVARIALLFVIIAYLRKSKWTKEKFDTHATNYLMGFIVAYLMLLAIHLFYKLHAAKMGIDFSIFSQAIHSVSKLAYPATSLISRNWVNFLGHHFAPFLFVPGIFGYLGIVGTKLAIITHLISFSLCIFALYKLARQLGYQKSYCLIFVVLFLMNPSIRHSIFWGLHDESFALGAIAFSYLFWQRKNHWLCALCLLIAASTKESLFLFNICFTIMTFWVRRDQPKAAYISVFVVSIIGFIGYFFLQPIIFGKTFDHFGKLSSFSQITFTVKDKSFWLFSLFLPTAFYPLRNFKNLIYLLPASPFIAIVAVAQFPEMYKPFNYYTIIPTLIIYISCLFFFKNRTSFSKLFVITASILAMSLSGSKPSKQLIQNISNQVDFEIFADFQQDEVIVTAASAPFLIGAKRIERLWIANKNSEVLFDKIITRIDEKHLIGGRLLAASRECGQSKDWYIRCKK